MRYLFLTFVFFIFLSCKNDQTKQTDKNQTVTSQKIKDKEEITVASEHLIIPNKQIGEIQLEKDVKPLLAKLGEPDFSNAAMGKALMTWNDVKNGTLSIFTSQKMGVEDFSRIKAIRSRSDLFRTKQNIGKNSSLKEIQDNFNVEEIGIYIEEEEAYSLYVDNDGIGFEIDDDEVCQGVIILGKGKEPQQFYIPFYDNFHSKN